MDAQMLDAAVASCLAGVPDLVAGWIFGSTARGSATGDSDLDVAILVAHAPPRTLQGLPFDMQFAMEERLGRRADVVVLNDAPVDLIHRVLRDGRLVLERDRGARIRFEVRSRNEYFDLLPILRRYRRLDARRDTPGAAP